MARIACLAALAAGLMAAGGGNAWAANLELPAAGTGRTARAEVSFAPGLTGWLLPALPSAADLWDPGAGAWGAGPADLPVLPDEPASDEAWIPILGIILAGLVWRYRHSPEYGALYDRLYGPLSGY